MKSKSSLMTSVRILSSNLNVMEKIESRATVHYSREQELGNIKIPLYPHQRSALERMREIEESTYGGMCIGGETLFSSYGILGERAGTGKTLTMLAHIDQMSLTTLSQNYREIPTLHPASSPTFFGHGSRPSKHLLPTLIIVPHTLFYQWQREIRSTTLSCTSLISQKDIDHPLLIERMESTHVTLISNTLLQSLTARFTQLVWGLDEVLWDRIVYDEADVLRIPSGCIPLETRMTWLITSRYRNITHANQQIHSHVVKQLPQQYIDSLSSSVKKYVEGYIEEHPQLTLYKTASEVFFRPILANRHPSRGYFVVKTDDASLDASLSLPSPVVQTILCKPEHGRTMELLHKGHVEDAVLSIHPQTMTLPQIIATVDQHSQTRLQENTSCSICYETAEPIVPCVIPCCMNLFCGRCILTWFDRNAKCPLCQALVAPTSLIKIDTGAERPPLQQTKYEHLIRLLQDKGDGQYILFSRNPQKVFSHILDTLPNLRGQIGLLHGNKTVISNLVSEFNKKTLRILCFSGDSLGTDLHSATHILIMDRLRGDEEEYIIGRAQRIGRKVPLQQIYFSEST
jgi:hypothetical protein